MEQQTVTVSDLVKQHGITAKATFVARRAGMEDWPAGSTHYRMTLRRANAPGRLSVMFSQGPAHTEPPKADAVLDCLLSDAQSGDESYEDFCSNMGMDTDSRKAHRTWKACVSIRARLETFLGDDFDAFMSAERL